MSGNEQPGNGQPQGGQQPQGGRQPQGNRQPQGGRQPQGNQPPQGGGQPQGGQPQANQPQQGGRQPQAGPPPQGGGGGNGGGLGGGFGDDLNTDSVRRVALFGIAALAIAGIVLGLSPFIAGFVGDTATGSVPANSTQAQNQAENTSEANEIVTESLSDDNLSAANSYERMQYQNDIVGSVIAFTPYLGFLFALIVGLVIGVRSGADQKELAAGVAAAALVGLVLFTVLGTALAGFQYNSMSTTDWEDQYDTNPSQWNGPGGYPSSDINQTEFQQANVSADDASIGGDFQRIGTISALQISYVTLAINSLGFGIFAALGAAGLAIVGRRFSE